MALPLFKVSSLSDLVICSVRQSFTYRQLLSNAKQLAKNLPRRKHMILLCQNRFHFLQGFCAALINGQTCIFPPNYTDVALTEISKQYPDSFILADNDINKHDFTVVKAHTFEQSDTDETIPDIEETAIAAILYTSGTSGKPIGHSMSWGMLCALANNIAEQFPSLQTNDCGIVATVPSQHMFGFEHSIVFFTAARLACT